MVVVWLSGCQFVRLGEDVDNVWKMWSGCGSVCCRNVVVVVMSNARPKIGLRIDVPS